MRTLQETLVQSQPRVKVRTRSPESELHCPVQVDMIVRYASCLTLKTPLKDNMMSSAYCVTELCWWSSSDQTPPGLVHPQDREDRGLLLFHCVRDHVEWAWSLWRRPVRVYLSITTSSLYIILIIALLTSQINKMRQCWSDLSMFWTRDATGGRQSVHCPSHWLSELFHSVNKSNILHTALCVIEKQQTVDNRAV